MILIDKTKNRQNTKYMKPLVLLVLIALFSCSNSGNSDVNFNDNAAISDWNVPIENIAGSGSFPVMDNPIYNSVAEVEAKNYLNGNSKLALLKIENEVYAYPFDYTNNYEVINDSFGDIHVAISYCPITESALCFDRKISTNEIITMKASGFLFKDNLIPTDINLKYYWSQMLGESIRGDNLELKLKTYNIVESTWQIVKDHFPDALVFNHPDVVDCNCNETPTPIDFNNLFGVIHGHVLKSDITHLFNYNDFENGNKISYVSVNSQNVLVVGSKNKVFFNAFYIPGNLTFEVLEENEFPNVLQDNEGNNWDIFGYAVEGPRLGDKLNSPKSYVAAEWAWNTIFEDLVYHN